MDDAAARRVSFARTGLAVVLVGVASGLAGGLITLALHAVQHLAFGYTEDTFLIGVEHATDARRVGALAIGGAIAGVGWFLRRRWVSNETVSVTHALRAEPPRLPVLATTADALLQTIAVGAGASMGREGAPRQTAAAVSWWIARRLALTAEQQRVLLACGAGAGLAAVYNVPLGGAAFTIEVLLGAFGLWSLAAALVTSVVATVVAWPLLGTKSTYPIPAPHLHAPVIVWAVLLAPVAGTLAVAFRSGMTLARTHAPAGGRAALTTTVVFAGLGALAIAYPQLPGNGKSITGLAFGGSLSLGIAAALVLLKPAATAACLGAGAIGGLLTPALATGASLGVVAGRLWTLAWPGSAPVEYAMVAAAAFLSVTMRAPVTAIVLTLEFTGTGLALVVPMVICVVGAVVVSIWCERFVAARRVARPRPAP